MPLWYGHEKTVHEAVTRAALGANSKDHRRVAMPQPEQQQDVTHSSASRTPHSRILVIDDGDSVRDVIGVFLENAGFEVCGEAARDSRTMNDLLARHCGVQHRNKSSAIRHP